MIQSLSELTKNVERSNAVGGSSYGHIQKVYSTTRYICLVTRFPQKTRFFYFGRGHGFEGFWEGKAPPPSDLRVYDKFVGHLRKHLLGGQLGPLVLDTNDRIICLPYFKNSQTNYLLLFWAGRSLYFLNNYYDLNKEAWRLFTSWEGFSSSVVNNAPIDLFHYFNGVGRKKLEIERTINSSEHVEMADLIEDEREQLKSNPNQKKKKKFLIRKKKKIEADIEKAKGWMLLERFIHSEQSEVMITESNVINVNGIELKFDKEWNQFKRKGLIFEKIKRLKKAEVILQDRLNETSKELTALEGGHQSNTVENLSLNIISPVWHVKKPVSSQFRDEKSIGGPKDVLFFKLESGAKVGLGKSSQANDFLRINWASKEDLWFHLDGYVSSHAIVKVNSMAQITLDDLVIIASAITDYSKLTFLSVPLIYTNVKNLKGVKGRPGMVTYKKERHIVANYLKDWRAKLALVDSDEP